MRRFARIWPLHFVTLLISLFAVIGVETYFKQPAATAKLMVNSLLLQSWIPNYKWIYSLNGPAWSLSVEAFFYMIYPLLLLGGARKFMGKYCFVIIASITGLFAINQFAPTNDDAWVKINSLVHTNPLMRLFECATGNGSGFLYPNRKNSTTSQRGWKLDSVFELASVGALIAFFIAGAWLGLYSENRNFWNSVCVLVLVSVLRSGSIVCVQCVDFLLHKRLDRQGTFLPIDGLPRGDQLFILYDSYGRDVGTRASTMD